jgi:hypothetical protein
MSGGQLGVGSVVFHPVRITNTRIFLGLPSPSSSPYHAQISPQPYPDLSRIVHFVLPNHQPRLPEPPRSFVSSGRPRFLEIPPSYFLYHYPCRLRGHMQANKEVGGRGLVPVVKANRGLLSMRSRGRSFGSPIPTPSALTTNVSPEL